jgi:ferritin
MLFKALEDMIDEQIWDELYSAHLYLSMSAYCEAKSLPGFARWVPMQAQHLE